MPNLTADAFLNAPRPSAHNGNMKETRGRQRAYESRKADAYRPKCILRRPVGEGR
jgi:hypothetical protein